MARPTALWYSSLISTCGWSSIITWKSAKLISMRNVSSFVYNYVPTTISGNDWSDMLCLMTCLLRCHLWWLKEHEYGAVVEWYWLWENWSVLRKKNAPQITHRLTWYQMWAASVKMGCYHRSPPKVSVINFWMTWCHSRILETSPSVEISVRLKALEWIL